MSFSSSFFVQNRQKLCAAVPDCDMFVFPANGQMQRSGDTAFPFRQDSNFWYLTGVTEPDMMVVIHRDETYLIVPPRDEVRTIFDGSIPVSDLSKTSGIAEVLDQETGWQKLTADLKRAKKAGIFEPIGGYVEHYGFYANPARATLVEAIRHAAPKVKTVDVRMPVATLRMIKQPEELAAIQRAIDITSDTLSELLPKLTDYQYEYQLEAAITEGFRRRGATGHAYEPIVAAGKNACVLHYIKNADAINPDELLLLDVGAEYLGYAADITRTYAVHKPSARQQEVHHAVLDLQYLAFDSLKPGITMHDYEMAIENQAGKILRRLGITGTEKREVIRRYYPHATSHFLGLDVHDVGDYERPLEPGMVMTVEPGIYLPEEGIGIRTEDNIVITKGGIEVLSGNLPRTLG